MKNHAIIHTIPIAKIIIKAGRQPNARPVTDDGAGDRAAQRRACAEKADGGSRLLLGNQPLIILFADAQIGPSAIPKSTRSTSME